MDEVITVKLSLTIDNDSPDISFTLLGNCVSISILHYHLV